MADTTSLLEIRSWWEVPCIAHFCHTFSESLELPAFDIEELELSLVPSHETTDAHPLIVGIHIAFLKGILEKKEIGPDNWELLLRLHFVWRSEFLNEKYSPMEEASYHQLNTRSKVEILHKLCHLRMELDDVTECLRSVEPCQMRLEEVGVDRGGHKLWYFYGMRLYRESKEAQQHNKRYKSSSSLKSRLTDVHRISHKEPATTPAACKNNKQEPATSSGDLGVSGAVQGRAQLKIEGSDLERGDSCASGDDSCRQDTRRVTRSTRHKSGNGNTQDTQETASCTEASSPLADPTTAPREMGSQSPVAAAVGENEFSLRTGWSVLCVDVRDWEHLLSSFEASSHACELEVVKYVREQLMESLMEIHTERSRTERFLALSESAIPKRTSQRLNKKLKASSQAEQIDFVGPSLKSRSPCVEGKVAADELNQSDSESYDTELEEEKKRERDEVRRRRTLDWEKAYSGNIQGPRNKSNLPNSALAMEQEEEINGEDLRIAMLKVIDDLKKHEDCWPFVDPVTEAIAPGYSDVIKQPMDVVTIEKKLKNEDYSNKEQFVKDFRRVFKNCRRYNGPDSEYTEMAHTIREHFNKLFTKHFSHPGPNGRARSPIPGIGSSSESEGGGTPFKSPGVKRRRKQRTDLTESLVQKSSTSKRSRNASRNDQMRLPPYPPPFYPPYPPFATDKDSGAIYPPFPHEYSPFPYFPPFMPSPHPPFPPYPLYWGTEPPHKGRSAPEGATAGSTKERREEEARLQTVIRSQGLLSKSLEAKQKSEKVSSTTAEQKSADLLSLSSPESVTLASDLPDPSRHREDNESKGSVDSRTSSCSSAAGVGPPPHTSQQAPYPASSPYGHMQHPFHHPYYASPYMDYMMDSYFPGPPFFSRQGQFPTSSRHHRKHKHKTAEREGQGTPQCDVDPKSQQQQQQQQINTNENIDNVQTEVSQK